MRRQYIGQALLAAILVALPSRLFAVDPGLVDSLRWRTSGAGEMKRYFWILSAAVAICVAIWLTYVLVQRLQTPKKRTSRRKAPARPKPVSTVSSVIPLEPLTSTARPSWRSVDGIDAGVKARAVIRLIQGDDVDEVANEIGVTTALCRDWVERFVRAGKLALEPEGTWSTRR